MGFINWVKQYFQDTGNSYKRGFKRLVFAAPFWVILISVVLIFVGFIRIGILKYNRADQNMAEYWEQGSNVTYRELSVYARGSRNAGETSPLMYINQDISLKKSDVNLIRTDLQTVVDSGLKNRKENGLDKEGRPVGWEDCYSSTIVANVAIFDEEKNTSSNINADTTLVAVGGNYKAFYPFVYMSGGFLPETCTDQNQIVLNDVLAWRFFKSNDVVGHKVVIWDQVFTVVGVVSEPDSKLDQSVGSNAPRAYIYFSAMEKYTSEPSSGEEGFELDITSECAIQCYQAILPEIVKGVAENDFKSAIPNYNGNNPQLYVVSNTGRYNVLRVWDDMVPLGETAGIMSNYELPYIEKAAWLTTQHIFVCMVMIVLGFVLFFIGIIMTVMHFRKIDKTELQHSSEQIEE